MPTVVIKKCPNYQQDLLDNILEKSINLLGGIKNFISPGENVLLKPNLLSPKSVEKSVTTQPEIMRAAIRLVKKAGGTAFIGDSPSLVSAKRVAEKCGIAAVARQEGVEIIEFSANVEMKGIEGGLFKRLKIAKEVLQFDKVINLFRVKTHGMMAVTLACKNLFGCLAGREKLQWHLKAGIDREYFARLLIETAKLVRAALHIGDGIISMDGNGPGAGRKRNTGLLFIGTDPIALDTVIINTLGLPLQKCPTLSVSKRYNYGETDLAKIEILGEELEEVKIGDFLLPRAVAADALIPGPIRRYFKNALTSRPLIEPQLCNLCLECVKICPAKVMNKKNNKIEISYKNCIRCFCCQEICPQGAISIEKGWLIRLLSK